MATVAQFLLNGSLVVDVNSSTLTIAQYAPARPNLLGSGRLDLVTRVKDEFELIAKAATLDALANALGTLERYLFQASQNPANVLSFVWQPDTLTNAATVNVYEGSLKRDDRAYKTHDGYYMQRAVVEFVRDPVWLGTWTSITFDAGTTPATVDNDDTCYVVLPTLTGDLPAPCQFMVASSGGNTSSAKRALIALKARGTPANFSHILQVESADVLYGSLTNATGTKFSPGTAGTTAKRYTGADTTWRQLAQWNKTSNVSSWVGSYLALLRVIENTTTRNFRLKLRGGDIVGSSYLPGPWATAEKVRTPNTTVSGNEALLLDLGVVRVPRVAGRNYPYGGVFFDLWGDALAASGSLDLDALYLFPVGECGAGLGNLAAEFDTDFSAGRFTFDSRPTYPLAYLHDGTNWLTGASNIPQGGALYLMPQTALQRVYFFATRNEAGYFKHDINNTFSVTGYYQPRWAHMAGTQ